MKPESLLVSGIVSFSVSDLRCPNFLKVHEQTFHMVQISRSSGVIRAWGDPSKFGGRKLDSPKLPRDQGIEYENEHHELVSLS